MVIPVRQPTNGGADGLGGGTRPSTLAVVFAFGILYLGYGLNFLAVRAGVENFPPFLFAGTHVFLAGLLLALWGALRGQSLALDRSGLQKAALAGLFLFVGGVGLVTLGESLGVASGIAAIVKASAPLWVGFFEAVRPGGERPNRGTGFGLLLGAAGVISLVIPRLDPTSQDAHPSGIVVLMLSAVLFAIGTLVVRHCPASPSTLTGIVWQMLIGGGALLAIGITLGEPGEVEFSSFAAPSVAALLFLLFIHSLGAFSAMNWLLRYFPAPVVASKFYVSPAIAVTAGWLIYSEPISSRTIWSLLLILAGVGTLMWAARSPRSPKPGAH